MNIDQHALLSILACIAGVIGGLSILAYVIGGYASGTFHIRAMYEWHKKYFALSKYVCSNKQEMPM